MGVRRITFFRFQVGARLIFDKNHRKTVVNSNNLPPAYAHASSRICIYVYVFVFLSSTRGQVLYLVTLRPLFTSLQNSHTRE